ncbi:MAG TPA: hypothetical protein VEH04_19165 [Verrucomicrobiae bacterium]|nr:hypothetical protein [Verrucomicrobiae bacterium]
MIHIATVHFKSDRWISTQQEFLRKNIEGPHRIYAWLNDIPNARTDGFHYCCQEAVTPHAIKLNLLGDMMCFAAEDDDILIFIDGDAFPIAPIEPLLRAQLPKHKLVAVQRLENNGDLQPHPCFCATTARFWREIQGDWKAGYQWQTATGRMETDVGGNLLKILRGRNVDWLPLLRSHDATHHPVLFGIYAGLVYHHGAGFREAVTRFDMVHAKLNIFDRLLGVFPSRQRRIKRRKLGAENKIWSEQVFAEIHANPRYFEERLTPQHAHKGELVTRAAAAQAGLVMC